MGKDTGKPDGRASSWSFTLVKCFLVFACIVLVAYVCLVPVFAVIKLVGDLGQAVEGLVAFFCGALLLIALLATGFLLTCDWSQLGWLLLAMLAWLLFGGLL